MSIALPTQRFVAGYARMKTKSGCLTCRRRRKKCDESKPMCTGCTRNELSCSWPSTKFRTCSRKDILLNKGLPVVTSLITRGLSNTPPLPTSLLDSDRQTYIISFTMDYYLPIQVHRYQGLAPVDQSHIISMSFHSPALMNILLANAALTLNSHVTDWRTFEIESYICTVREVRQIIQEGDLKGREDSLLATVMWLCIFENSRLDRPCSQSGTHLAAFAKLLQHRTPCDQVQSSAASRTFERVCVEYYVYHSGVIMLFDQSIDPTASLQQLQAKFPFFEASSESSSITDVVQSPVLGTSYQVFVAMIEITRLARNPAVLGEETPSHPHDCYSDVSKWQRRLDQDPTGPATMRGGKLYEIATRLLILLTLSSTNELNAHEIISEVNVVASEALRRLLIQPLGGIFGKYWLWPFAIIGSVMTRRDDIDLMRDKMDAIAQRSNCNAIKIIRYLLESIWANNANSSSNAYSLKGLVIILDGNLIENTSSLLLSYKSSTG